MPFTTRPQADNLIRIGMENAAQWVADGKNLRHEGTSRANLRRLTAFPISLYAFVCEGEVLYIGKTTQSLHKRFAGYCDPGNGRATNWKCHQGIKKLIASGKAVRIFVLPQTIPLEWGGYPVNRAAGLEDALVKAFQPAWNGSNAKFLSESEAIEERAKKSA